MKKLALIILMCIAGCTPRAARQGRPITVYLLDTGHIFYCAQAMPGIAMNCVSGSEKSDVLLFGASPVAISGISEQLGGLNGQSQSESEGR